MHYASTLLIAQSLGEYGGMGAALSEAFFRLRLFVENELFDLSPRGWMVVGGAFLVLWFAFRGRR